MKIFSHHIASIAAMGIGLFPATVHPADSLLLSDDFTNPIDSINTEKWTKGGVYTPIHTVANGQLTMRSAGWAHHAYVTSVYDSFNFLERGHTVSVALTSFPAPDWESDPVNLTGLREVFFVLGPSSTWDHYVDWNDQYYKWEGFGFSLRWQVTSIEEPKDGRLEIFSPNPDTGIDTQEISNVPTGLTYSVDPDAFTIELQGATFVDSGLSTLSGPHTLDSSTWDDRYYLMVVLHQSALDVNVFSEVIIDSISVYSDEATSGPTEWAGYPILEDNWVDTGGWLGYLYVEKTPWIYSDLLGGWIYLPETYVFPYGAWLYAPRW